MGHEKDETKPKSETVEVFDDRLSESEETSADEDKKYRDGEWLYQQYNVLGKTQKEIGEECGVSKKTISKWMQKCGVEAEQGSRKKGKWDSKEWLSRQYHENGKTIEQIANKNGCHWTTIKYWFDKHGIERRSPSEYHPDILEGRKYHDRDWLYHQYVELEKGCVTIANELGVGDSTISAWLQHHDIETRTAAESSRITSSIPIYVKEDEDEDEDEDEIDESSVDVVTRDVGMRQYEGSELGIDSSHTHFSEKALKKLDSPYRDEDWFREQYNNYGTLTAIGEKFGISIRTLSRWANKHGIETKRHEVKYSRKDILEAIQRCASEIGEPLRASDYYEWSKEQEDAPSDQTIRNHESIDDWTDAVESADVIGANSEVDCPVGDELRQLRQSMDLTQGELADKVGTTLETIGRYEREGTTPRTATALQLRSVFDWS